MRKPRRDIAPLTGLVVAHPNKLLRPALAVKIDNLDTPGESALPQTGLNQADVVFEEVVEADITRLVAVFHSVDYRPGRTGAFGPDHRCPSPASAATRL